ncbi:MAG TPA: DUF4399 domain-containing protein [Vicinamibacterales bacterium]|nr:DUF4399 domain-containing protein [Vicinamibacterales bacterium]
MRIVNAVMLGLLIVAAAACGRSETPPPAATTSAPATPAAAPPANRVFFVTPTNGATVKPMSTIEFGSSGVTVGAVPPGELKPEQVRPNTIHYHIAVDADCLAPGTVIPKADPWVHFGDGKNVIEMSLPTGAHRLTVQAGDDMHRTIAGLCETINVTVAK